MASFRTYSVGKKDIFGRPRVSLFLYKTIKQTDTPDYISGNRVDAFFFCNTNFNTDCPMLTQDPPKFKVGDLPHTIDVEYTNPFNVKSSFAAKWTKSVV